MRRSVYERVMDAVGTEYGGTHSPPEARTLYYWNGREVPRGTDEAYVIAANNDGTELWIGTPHQWYHHMGSPDVRLLLRWLIVDWYIKARWLGLRRPIYYWALHRELARWRRQTRADA